MSVTSPRPPVSPSPRRPVASTDAQNAKIETVSQQADAADAIAAELHERYWKRLLLFASSRLRDAAAAEDVAQETLRRVLEALRGQRVENLNALPGFVFQTARNICMHRGRSTRRERGALFRFSSGSSEIAEDNPADALLTRERLAAVREAVGKLEPSERQLLEMLYVEVLDTREIAARMSIDPGTLRVRKHRLLKRLAEMLGNDSPPTATREVTW